MFLDALRRLLAPLHVARKFGHQSLLEAGAGPPATQLRTHLIACCSDCWRPQLSWTEAPESFS